ncbi:multiubiquitin domain-containing protein [Parasediminibacterium sp. JCM 36343]|uniref:multiubiquitin domain-containing protein n=1 Tax=Parasediminibacterium sp. JCM 36343 TaxID=3374279 RepID=UPI00397E677A
MNTEKDHEHGEHVLHFTINGEPFKSHKQYITGAEIKKIGNIPEEDEVFLKVEEGWENQLIKDEDSIDLAVEGKEHFFSKEKHKEVIIIVDGSPKKWDKKKINFKEVIILAYGTFKDNWTYTVGYEDGPKENPEGSMIKDSEVFVKNKMIFHATATDKS